MNTGCRAVLFSMVFFLAAGAACAGDNDASAQAAAPGMSGPGVVENRALGASFIDAAKAKLSRHGVQTMIVEGINDQGWIVGRWTDQAGHSHRFLMNLFLPAFSDIANHGATGVQVWTVSDTGQVTMETNKRGYITCLKRNGGVCGSHTTIAVNADKSLPGLFSPALCASGCKLAEAQATVQ